MNIQTTRFFKRVNLLKIALNILKVFALRKDDELK